MLRAFQTVSGLRAAAKSLQSGPGALMHWLGKLLKTMRRPLFSLFAMFYSPPILYSIVA